GVGERLLESLRVVGKAEGIRGSQVHLELLLGAVVDQQVGLIARANAPMILAVRAHVEIPPEFLTDVRMTARLAFLPDIGRNLETLAPRLPDLLFLAEPSHERNVIRASRVNNGLGAWRFVEGPRRHQTVLGPAPAARVGARRRPGTLPFAAMTLC